MLKMAVFYLIIQFISTIIQRSSMASRQSDSNMALRKKLLIYSVFQNNVFYKERGASLKNKVLASDNETLLYAINCIKNILSHRRLSGIEQIAQVEQADLQSIQDEFRQIRLSEYSKLLALRFIREIYFQSFYPFVLLVDVELAEVFSKIAFFKSESLEEKRGGQLLLDQQNGIFKVLNNKSEKSGLQEEELQRIGYSIHKMVLEFIRQSANVYKKLPFHQQFSRGQVGNEYEVGQLFKTNFYKINKKLIARKVNIPKEFTYFKQDEHISFIRKYQTINAGVSIRNFYIEITTDIWKYLEQFIFDSTLVDFQAILFDTGTHFKIDNLRDIIRKIAFSEERYFWGYLDIFLNKGIMKITKMHQNKQQLQCSDINAAMLYFYFIGYCFFYLSNPQFCQFVQQKHIQTMTHLLKKMLKFNQLLQQKKDSKSVKVGKERDVKIQVKKSIQNMLTIFKMMNQFQLVGLSDQYKQLSKTIKIINRIKCMEEKSVTRLTKKINQIAHQNYNQINVKITFLTYFQNENRISISSQKEVEQKVNILKEEIQKLFAKQMTNFYFSNQQLEEKVTKKLFCKQLQKIVIPADQISVNQIQCVTSQYKTSQKAPNSRRSWFRVNLAKQFGEGKTESKKESSQQSKKSYGSLNQACNSQQKLSFRESLKVNLSPPSSQLVRQLSLGKNRRIQIRKASDLIIIKNSLKSIVLDNEEDKVTKLLSNQPKDQMKFKSCFNQYDFILPKKRQSLVLQRKDKCSLFLQKKAVLNGDRQLKRVIRGTKINNNNFQPSKKGSIQSNTTYDSDLINPGGTQKTKLGSCGIKENVKKQFSVEKLQNKNVGLSINQNQTKNIEKIVTSSENSIKSPIQNAMDQTIFCFTEKSKRDFMKGKCFVKKNSDIEIGMVTKLQEQIEFTEHKPRSKFYSLISIYVTALASIQNLHIQLQLPSWVVCTSSENNKIDKILTNSQKCARFKVQIAQDSLSISNHNYGKLPVLNTFYYKEDKMFMVTEQLSFLITKFTKERGVDSEEIFKLLENEKSLSPTTIYSKINKSIQGLSEFFPRMQFLHLSKHKNKMLRQKWNSSEIGVTKMRFVHNRKNVYLLFLQRKGVFSEKEGKIKGKCLQLLVIPEQKQKWDEDQFHVLDLCFRSIFSI